MSQRNPSTDFVFTAATLSELGNERYARNFPSRSAQCALIFGRRSAPLDLNNVEYHKEIASSDVTRSFLGNSFLILPYSNTADISYYHSGPPQTTCALIAAPFPDRDCLTMIEKLKTFPITRVVDGEVFYEDSLDVFNSCGLPDKYVLGCSNCVADPSSSAACSLLRCITPPATYSEFDIDDYMLSVDYWKTQIGRFTAIGPALTSSDAIPSAHRHFSQHHFTWVDENISTRKRAIETKARRRNLHAQICPECSMQDACWSDGKPYGCNRSYCSPVKELAKEIVSNVHCDFTGPQLRILLANSGPLDSRIERYKGIFTLTYSHLRSRVEFAINQKTCPGNHLAATANFKTALAWIKEYLEYPELGPGIPPTSVEEKATLFELLHHRSSPTYHNGWRKTSYELNYIERPLHGQSHTMYFSWDRAGRTPLPWTVEAANLSDVYRNYRVLHRASGEIPGMIKEKKLDRHGIEIRTDSHHRS